ncbi:hypothetical protein AB1Y20_008986 [Prymnesium parvum]|uniref:Neurotransmitter-gated ion-channel ligand-binding domain-containing protein n=1 Tax=Prymnesium parvum TaxID=97485 RepID=A0AB34K0T8_PRYPA
MTVTLRFKQQLQFSYPRLSRSPCYEVLVAGLLSVTASEAASSLFAARVAEYRSLFFLPRLAVSDHDGLSAQEPTIVNGLSVSRYKVGSHQPWIGYGGEGSICIGPCVVIEEDREIVVPQNWKYYYFPFDQHDIQFSLYVDDLDMNASCALLGASILDEAGWSLLSEWALNPEGDSDAATTYFEADSRICHVSIKVKRLSTLFMVRTFTSLVLIVWVSLLSLRINPFAPPLFASRCASLVSSMILVMLNRGVASNESLGNVGYLVWSDVFSICQFVNLAIAVMFSVYIHQKAREGNMARAVEIDSVIRDLIPFGLYPVSVFGMLVSGLTRTLWAGIVFFFCGRLPQVDVFCLVAFERAPS